MASTTELVHIHYRRPPDRADIFIQRLVHRTADCIVTLAERTPVAGPLVIEGAVALEPDAPAIWFTFPGVWHDIGRFHLRDGSFTGTYANAITPVRFLDDRTWETTDLFLDLWLEPGGHARVLDEDELDAARAAGWIDESLARRARREIERIAELIAAGAWPPPIVGDWTLERLKATGAWAGPPA